MDDHLDRLMNPRNPRTHLGRCPSGEPHGTLPPASRDRRRRPRPTAGDTAASGRGRDAGRDGEERPGRPAGGSAGRERAAGPAGRVRPGWVARVPGDAAGAGRRRAHTLCTRCSGPPSAASASTTTPLRRRAITTSSTSTRPSLSTSTPQHDDALAPAGCCRRVPFRSRPPSPVARPHVVVHRLCRFVSHALRPGR